MSITIELTPELEAKVQRNAESKGLPVGEYVLQTLHAAPIEEKSLWETLSPEEFARSLREWSESHEWPPLSEEAMSRESIYGDNH